MYAAKGQHEAAVTDYDQALRLQPNHDGALRERCASLQALGRGC
jgi:tetratricopeptide (TPR) repeat protein